MGRPETTTTNVGDRYGSITIIAPLPPRIPTVQTKYYKRIKQWLCRCDCGTEWPVDQPALRNGNAKRCFACRSAHIGSTKTTHGNTRGHSMTAEYRAWTKAKSRCLCPTDHKYPIYGGRGISMCQEWRDSFEAFLSHMGKKPSPRMSLDRIDVNGNYEPGNCRWTSAKEQALNQRRTVRMDWNGGRFTVSQIADMASVQRVCLKRLLAKGASLDRAISDMRKRKYGRNPPPFLVIDT